MLTAAALAIALMGHGRAWTTTHIYHREQWELAVTDDRFSGKVSCLLKTERVRVVRDTLIFKMGQDAETADAYFRVDNGPIRNVREAMALDMARGFFPDRGWIEDPTETAVALPSSYARGATSIIIRANVRSRPREFRINGLAAMLRSAAGFGCPVHRI